MTDLMTLRTLIDTARDIYAERGATMPTWAHPRAGQECMLTALIQAGKGLEVPGTAWAAKHFIQEANNMGSLARFNAEHTREEVLHAFDIASAAIMLELASAECY